MPQQQQPSIKIIPKEVKKDAPWVNIAFAIGGVLFVVVLVPFFLSRGQIAKLEERKQGLDTQIVTLVSKYDKMTKDLSVVAAKIDNFAVLFKEHRVLSGLFDFMGSIAHPLTQFTNFSFSDENFLVSVSVSTENFRTLGEQFVIFEENVHIIQPKISGINLDREGFVNAQFDFSLDKGLIMPFSLATIKPASAIDVPATSTPATDAPTTSTPSQSTSTPSTSTPQ